jgi:hypothetical protein
MHLPNSRAYNGPVAPKKKTVPPLKNKWIKIRADDETRELFQEHAAAEKMPVTIWARHHLMAYIESKPPLKPKPKRR